jgi:hypothetical protein
LRGRSRTQAVKALGFLDKAAELPLRRFAEGAALSLDAPLAMLSLIHNDRTWFKATFGLAIEAMPRDLSCCTHVLDPHDVLEGYDAQIDPRFRELPVVTSAPFFRYYIGAPLRLIDGMDVGAPCVADGGFRMPVSSGQRACLLGLARQTAMVLDERCGRPAEFAT